MQSYRYKILRGISERERKRREGEIVSGWKRVMASVINLTNG